jgi:hypothetical protein
VPAVVRDGQAGAAVAAVGDHRGGGADGGLGSGFLPGPAVVAVAGQRPADGDDQAGVGVDDDLVAGGGGSSCWRRPRPDPGWGPACRPR